MWGGVKLLRASITLGLSLCYWVGSPCMESQITRSPGTGRSVTLEMAHPMHGLALRSPAPTSLFGLHLAAVQDIRELAGQSAYWCDKAVA